ncbi:MAG TPA: sigma 54-interacting transcriptional regulator [Polyangiales bacterium]|nr:sigma 54-interacting transcriptional regulator [Polyangiales bacterium]
MTRGERGQSQHAAALLAELQPNARVGTYDRHCLIVIVPHARPEAAMQLARTLAVRLSGRGRIACGVAIHPEMATTPAQLVGSAERAARRGTATDPVVLAPPLPYVVEPRSGYAAPASGPLAELAPQWLSALANARAALLLGEAGAGKQSVARSLHAQGPRREAPFRVVNCAAIPEDAIANVLFAQDKSGAFAQAQGGSLFLDDVAALPLTVQATLARALESRSLPDGSAFDVQCLASSYQDLDALCAQGRFRSDLLQQLNGTVFKVPSLRERSAEILPLAEHFVANICAQWGSAVPRLTDETRTLLGAYSWPGNADELRHAMERAVALAEDDTITPSEFPEHVRLAIATNEPLPMTRSGFLDLRASLIDHEAMLIRQALQLSRGNQRKAASLLKLPLRTLERKLRNLGGRSRLMAS